MEAMTLEEAVGLVRGIMRIHPKGVLVRNAWEVLDAHLTQPAQAVDVGGVLVELRAAADRDGATMGQCFQWWRSLTRALPGEAGPVGDGWRDSVLDALRGLKCPHDGKNGDVYEKAAAHVWGDAIITAMRTVQSLPASPTPGKEG